MKKVNFYVVSSALMSILFVFNCASTTLIKTNDRNVKIYADGEYLGRGEAKYTSTKIVGSTTYIEFKKDGCRKISHSFSRDEKFAVGACIGGVLVWVPFLWVMNYKPVHQYDFECEKE